MVVPGPGSETALRGRQAECAALDALLGAVRGGESRTLVLRGEAGIGKTALLDYAAGRGAGFRVLRVFGVEAELELPFAAAQRLCLPLLDGLERLPQPQRDALGTAFGLSSGAPADRFLVGLAVLSLLSDAAEAQPLLCLVDDAQWLDRSSAQVISLVARRLQAESVAIVFAEREGDELVELAGLPELLVQRLSDADARSLFDSASLGSLDDRVRNRIIAEARGNPLALLELPRGVSAASRSGGFAPAEDAPLPGRLVLAYRRRVEQLPTDTQRLLLVAAAEPTGDPTLLWRAAAELSIPVEAAIPAEADDLLQVGARVAFRHPVLRSAVYRAAPPDERRGAHRALAEVTDGEADPDRRAWHRAHATLAPDEEVAAELELSAGRAQARGGLSAAGAFLARAAELTPDSSRRAVRALAAARAKRLAGLPNEASALLAAAEQGPLDERDSGLLLRLRGQIALDLSRGSDAAPLLLAAARRLDGVDAALARETHLEALLAATLAGRFGDRVHDEAAAARTAPSGPAPPRPLDLVVDGLAARFTDGYAAGAPILKRALAAFLEQAGDEEQDTLWTWTASRVAADVFDDEAWNELAMRHVRAAREAGALSVLPVSLNLLSMLRVFEADFNGAASALEEADAIADATGNARIVTGRLLLVACRGDAAEASALSREAERVATARGEGIVITFVELARALLHNGLGDYEAALAAAQGVVSDDELGVASWALPELVEAASRAGRPDLASDAADRLAERARIAATTLAQGLDARSRALVSDGAHAEELYDGAIGLLGRTRVRLHLARARLVYGEWLRREGRRVDAREQLREAYEIFSGCGADAFAERAGRELHATGETVRRRTDDARGQLTAQEEQIARLAVDGYTNPEIGAQLFLSPRTVEWHLRKVFTKLGISSRRQLPAALPTAGRAALPA